MTIIAGNWIESEYITVDDYGIHCSDDAPEEIKRQYLKYLSTINSSMVNVIEPSDDDADY